MSAMGKEGQGKNLDHEAGLTPVAREKVGRTGQTELQTTAQF